CTCEAFHRVRLSESAEEPARAITMALDEARLAPEDIQYVNLHGTSTELNDRVETRALKIALGKHAGKIPMSGLKSQTGPAQDRHKPCFASPSCDLMRPLCRRKRR